MRVPIRSLGAAALAAAALMGEPSGAAGADENPLPRFLESLQVGPAAEFRLVVLHPVLVPPSEATGVPGPALAAPSDAVGVDPAARNRTTAQVTSLGVQSLWAMPGDVLRLADGDYVVRSDAALPPGTAADVPVVRIATVHEEEKLREEPRWGGHIPGPAFLWTLFDSPTERALSSVAADVAKEAEVRTPRRSPLDFAGAEKLRRRVEEYKARLTQLPRPPAAGRRTWAGYAVVIDGGFAGFEAFADGATFAALWPGRLEGIAVEAAVAELENGVLDEDMTEAGDPDRHTSAVKDALLEIYGLTPRPRRVPGLGTVLPLEQKDDRGRAVVSVAGVPQHVVWVRDPAARRPADTPETPELDPGVIDRKFRPTEFEKRWRARRAGAKSE